MGNANSSNSASLRHDGGISRRRGRSNNNHHPHHQDLHAAYVNDHAWLDTDQSFSSTEANEPPYDSDETLSSTKNTCSLPIYWNVRLRAVDQRNNECPVCATEFEVNDAVALLPCGHYFCKGCMMKWTTYDKCTCPLCRHDLHASATARKRMYTRVTSPGKDMENAEHKLPSVHSPCTGNGLDQNFGLIMSKMLNDRAISTEDSSDNFSVSKQQ